MKFIKVGFKIDIHDDEQVKAMNDFISVLKKSEGEMPTIEAKVDNVKTKAETETSNATATPVKTAPVTTTTTAAPVTSTATTSQSGDSKKLEQLRVVFALKVPNHRQAIKDKLKEIGTDSLTNLPIDRYKEMEDFLNALP